MQNFADTQWQSHGYFVYQLTHNNPIAVRTSSKAADDNRTDLSFKKNDLVSADLIRPSRVTGSSNCPFLRLSDNSGWIFERKNGEVLVKCLLVEKGHFTTSSIY